MVGVVFPKKWGECHSKIKWNCWDLWWTKVVDCPYQNHHDSMKHEVHIFHKDNPHTVSMYYDFSALYNKLKWPLLFTTHAKSNMIQILWQGAYRLLLITLLNLFRINWKGNLRRTLIRHTLTWTCSSVTVHTHTHTLHSTPIHFVLIATLRKWQIGGWH